MMVKTTQHDLHMFGGNMPYHPKSFGIMWLAKARSCMTGKSDHTSCGKIRSEWGFGNYSETEFKSFYMRYHGVSIQNYQIGLEVSYRCWHVGQGRLIGIAGDL